MISSRWRWVAWTTPVDGDQAIAPQSLMLAERTVRIVVAMTWKFGYAAAAVAIIAANLSVSRAESSSSTPSTSNPRLAVKSSSLPLRRGDRLEDCLGGRAKAQEVNGESARHIDVMIGNEEDFTASLGFEVE